MVDRYKSGQALRCPECGKEQEDPVQDYTVPGRINCPVESECEHCFGAFIVTEVVPGDFEVEVP